MQCNFCQLKIDDEGGDGVRSIRIVLLAEGKGETIRLLLLRVRVGEEDKLILRDEEDTDGGTRPGRIIGTEEGVPVIVGYLEAVEEAETDEEDDSICNTNETKQEGEELLLVVLEIDEENKGIDDTDELLVTVLLAVVVTETLHKTDTEEEEETVVVPWEVVEVTSPCTE